MRSRWLIAGVLALLVGSAATVAPVGAEQDGATEVLLWATLTGDAEVPEPGDSDGFGLGAVHVSRGEMAAEYTFCFSIAAAGIASTTGAHIHPGAAGVAGGIVVPFEPPAPVSSGCVSVAAELGQQILADPEGY